MNLKSRLESIKKIKDFNKWLNNWKKYNAKHKRPYQPNF